MVPRYEKNASDDARNAGGYHKDSKQIWLQS